MSFIPLLFIGALAAAAGLPRIALNDSLFLVHIAVAVALALWYGAIFLRARSNPDSMRFYMRLAAPHYIQTSLQIIIFIYWGLYWELVTHNSLLFITQLLFGFAFEGLLSWSRGKDWRLGFGPVPIILSINLFLTFKDEWFIYQFLLIAVGFLAKEFIVWNRNGLRTHIFNPSAFTLFLFAIVLIATGQTDKTWAEEIATRLVDPSSHPYLLLFLIGLTVQILFRVTLVTLASAAVIYILASTYAWFTGVFWFVDAGIPIAVFLGLHLLITDPGTSPRNDYGRFLFGAIYGASVFGLYGLLEYFGEPRLYDKLLLVPALNLLVIPLERAGSAMQAKFLAFRERFAGFNGIKFTRWNLVHMSVWIALFSWMYWSEFIGPDHPGRYVEYWDSSCAQNKRNACRNLAELLRINCMQGDTSRCGELTALYDRRQELANPLQRLTWYGLACDVGSKPECQLYTRNLTTDMRSSLIDSCHEDDGATSCYLLGSSYLKGINRGPRDRAKAHDYIVRGCELGLAPSCSVAGMMYQFGFTVDQDVKHAVSLHKKACARAFAPSCVSLAEIHDTPGQPEANPALSGWYEAKACAIGVSPLC